MSEDTKKKAAQAAAEEAKETEQQPEAAADKAAEQAEEPKKQSKHKSGADEKLREAEQKLATEHDGYLRLAAEYDNFRKRSQKEKDSAYSNGKADAALAFLPVFDNLQRALAQPSEDAAYVKGVEMTMTQLRGVLEKLGITEIEVAGQPFDPNVANAVMHVEDENLGENVVAEVFQSGFRMGDKVIRFAMVKVAN